MLTVDAKGHILHVSTGATALWRTDSAGLTGAKFATLFNFDVVSKDADWADAQWEALLASALDRSIPLEAKPKDADPAKVNLRLERGDGGTCFALVTAQPPAATAAAATAPTGGDPFTLPLFTGRSGVGFFDLDFKTKTVRYSTAWKQLLGYADHELENTYDSWLRLIHPDDSSAAPDQVSKKAAAGGNRTFAVEFRMRHRRNHWVWLQCTGVQHFSQDGELERVTGIHLDITERKELEEQSFLADERLALLAGDETLAAFDLDFTQKRFWFSSAWFKLFGLKYNEQTAQRLETLRDLLPADLAKEGVESFLSAPATGQDSFLIPVVLRRPDGTDCRVLLGAHRQLSRKRELLRVVGYVVALPADSAPTEAGPAPAVLVSEAFAALGEGVLITNAHGAILYLNKKAEQLTGHTLQSARSLSMNDVFQLATRSGGRLEPEAVDLVLASRESPRLNSDHALQPAAGGPAVPIVWTARPATDKQGQVQGIVLVFRDPQEMTLTPEELIRANRFDALGQLAGGIAHDFNNLLATIMGGISLMKDTRDDSALPDAEQACMTAKGLTKQLLAFAKGSAAVADQVIAPAELLRDAMRVSAAGSAVQLQLEGDGQASPIEVDRGQMLQVFQNLIINAVQAMSDPSKGEIRLRCGDVEVTEGQIPPLPAGKYVQIEVQDNGSGIPPEVVDRIFDPFFTTKKQGTGLGLATVLSIVRKHGGQIGVASTPGTGTTFTVFLPRASRQIEVEARRPAALRFGTGRVLLMDDDPKICDITGNMLASLDYTHDVAKHGEEALAFYRRYFNVNRPYDVVILDLTIVGGMGGEDTFRALREIDPDVRAIISSGYDNDDMALRFLDMGFCGYLTKPYRVGDLGRILKKVLGK